MDRQYPLPEFDGLECFGRKAHMGYNLAISEYWDFTF